MQLKQNKNEIRQNHVKKNHSLFDLHPLQEERKQT